MQTSRFKISTRLGLAFGATVMTAVLTAVLALWLLSAVERAFDHMVTENDQSLSAAYTLSDGVHAVASAVRTVVLMEDADARGKEAARLSAAQAQAQAGWDTLQRQAMSDEGRRLLNAVGEARKVFTPVVQEVLKLAQADQRPDATTLLLAQAQPAQLALQESLAGYIRWLRTDSEGDHALLKQRYDQAQISIVLACVLASALSCGLGLWVTRSIVRPLDQAARAAERVAEGDLTQALQVSGQDETAALLGALARMQDSLAATVRLVRRNAESVALASGEIATGNNDLSARTEQQAGALEQTTTSMQALSTNVQHNADSAQQANQLAANASQVASYGGEVVGQVVQTMREIQASSHRIGDIIGVIDGIAFQTNILALNAAVEAARAGEQGRGFAVVASEVRSLAQRSAEAAREIKALISDSVDKVEHGTTLVDQAGETMSDVVMAIRRVSDIVGEISAASSEQSEGVALVGRAVTQMDQSTQQNAALVEQSAAAAESLRGQAQQLVEAVAFFKIGAQPGAAAASKGGARAAPAAQAAPRTQAPKPEAPRPETHQAPPKPRPQPREAAGPPPSVVPVKPVSTRAPDSDSKPYKGVDRRRARAKDGSAPDVGERRHGNPVPKPPEPSKDEWETF